MAGYMTKIPAREVWNQFMVCRNSVVQTKYLYTIPTITLVAHVPPTVGRIRASNPCGEYNFLDNTACNLASVNFRKFFEEGDKIFLI